MDKKELAKILSDHSISVLSGGGDPYKESDISDDMVSGYEDLFSKLQEKYPDEDFDIDDYEGESSDDYIEMLVKVAAKGGIELLEESKSRKGGGGPTKDVDDAYLLISDAITNNHDDAGLLDQFDDWFDNSGDAIDFDAVMDWASNNQIDVEYVLESALKFHAPTYPTSLGEELDDTMIDVYSDGRFELVDDIYEFLNSHSSSRGIDMAKLSIRENKESDSLYRWIVKLSGNAKQNTAVIDLFESYKIKTGSKLTNRSIAKNIYNLAIPGNPTALAMMLESKHGVKCVHMKPGFVTVVGDLPPNFRNPSVTKMIHVYEASDEITFLKNLPVNTKSIVLDTITANLDGYGSKIDSDEVESGLDTLEIDQSSGAYVVTKYPDLKKLAKKADVTVEEFEQSIKDGLSSASVSESINESMYFSDFVDVENKVNTALLVAEAIYYSIPEVQDVYTEFSDFYNVANDSIQSNAHFEQSASGLIIKGLDFLQDELMLDIRRDITQEVSNAYEGENPIN